MARIAGVRRSGPLLVALVLLHLVAISHQLDGGGGVSLLGRFVLTVLSPFQRATAGTVRGVGGLWSAYLDLRGVYEENARLQARLRWLELRAMENQDKARATDRLREIAALRELLPPETVAAEVIARDGLPWFRTLTLNKGSGHGVRLNAAVVCPSGVVGRVVAVGPDAARVQLLWDRDSGVGVRIERSRVTGVLSGQLGGQDVPGTELMMKYVPLHADVVVGDLVVTSGLDRIYPKGLVVGRVAAFSGREGMFTNILVAPSARFDQLEEVLVFPPEPAREPFVETVE